MSKINIYSFISNIFKEKIKSGLEEYLKLKNADLCTVDYKKNINFDEKILENIRAEFGQKVFVIKGFPKTEEDIPIVYLIVTPRFVKESIRRFGVKKTYSMIKDWIGSSKIGETTIVRYKILGVK